MGFKQTLLNFYYGNTRTMMTVFIGTDVKESRNYDWNVIQSHWSGIEGQEGQFLCLKNSKNNYGILGFNEQEQVRSGDVCASWETYEDRGGSLYFCNYPTHFVVVIVIVAAVSYLLRVTMSSLLQQLRTKQQWQQQQKRHSMKAWK